MKKYLKTFIFLILAFTFSFSVFNLASAAIVPCGPGTSKPSCQLCDLITLLKNISNFVITLAGILVVVYLLYGGFLMLTSAGSSKKVEEGRSVMTQAVIGLVIILSAWLIVDTTLRVFMGTNAPTEWGPWNTFPSCGELNKIIYGTNNPEETGGSQRTGSSGTNTNTGDSGGRTIDVNGQTIDTDQLLN